MLRLTDIKIYQQINLKDLYQVMYLDFIVSIWKKNSQIFIHILLFCGCAIRFIH